MSPNANYLTGRRWEYTRMKYYRDQGYTVIRASGSHGLFDLVCIRANEIMLIQCKVVSTDAEAERMLHSWRATAGACWCNLVGVHQVLEIKVKGSSTVLRSTV